MIRIADLYADIGGIRLGFEQAFGKENIDCVFTSEIDKHAVTSYSANFGEENIYGDIREISADEIPDHDILLAGFPCQSFSVAGLKKGFNDERGQAFFEIERILKAKKPPLLFLENVPNLKDLNNGAVFQFILEHLKELGYKINYEILNGKDFGVPQNRRRLYIVGYLDHSKTFEFPNICNEHTVIADILEKDVDASYIISDHQWNYFKKRSFLKKIGGFGKYNVYSGKEANTCTLLASYKAHCSRILIEMSEGNPRRLTERECARLQGFPDSFIINRVSGYQAYKQFGNSVCVPVIKAIANQIKETFFTEDLR
jgi:DNA (cytosine-5)-methyltransferase 1